MAVKRRTQRVCDQCGNEPADKVSVKLPREPAFHVDLCGDCRRILESLRQSGARRGAEVLTLLEYEMASAEAARKKPRRR